MQRHWSGNAYETYQITDPEKSDYLDFGACFPPEQFTNLV